MEKRELGKRLQILTPPRVFVAILFVSLFVLAVQENLDPDFFWHLRTGQLIRESGSIPRNDPFSYTIPDRPWTAHEWLSEVIFFGIYSVSGEEGLILFFAALITLAFLLVYRLSPGKPYLSGFVTLLAALASAVAWGVRPQIFTLLFTAIAFTVLEDYRRGKRNRLWLLPLLIALWVNIHGGYLLGLALVGIYFLGAILDRWISRSSIPIGPLAMALAFSLLATSVSPHGPAILAYPWATLTSPTMQAYIQEWLSPDFHQAQFLPFALLLLITTLAFALSRDRADPTELLLLLAFGFAALRSARNISLYAVLAAPIIARHLWSAIQESRWGDKLRPQSPTLPLGLSMVNWLLLLGAVLVAWLKIDSTLSNNPQAQAQVFPVAAVDWLESQGMRGRIFNAYQWGGYLIWRLYPEQQVFIDGRADVYGDAYIEDYLNAYWLRGEWSKVFAEHEIQLVLVQQTSPLVIYLASDSSWEELYSDELAIIFWKSSEVIR